MGRIILWAALALAYGAFLLWYGGRGEPLQPDEVERFLAEVRVRGADGADLDALRRFAEADDGREFFMVNLVQYRAHPVYADGRDPGTNDSEAVDRRYTRFMLPRLLARACHPVAAAGRIETLAGYEGAPPWSRVAVVRYRSRRDFLEIVTAPGWEEHSVHKWAAIERTMSMPSTPTLSLLGPRFALFTLLAALGLAGDALLRRLG